jgi:hypothetical protein
MGSSSWKASERRMARDVGTERIPVTGERDGSDFTDGIACYQLKVRRMLPAWLWRWLGGIQGTAARQGRIGVLVLRVPRMRDDEALVVLAWRDWVALHGDAGRTEGD